MKDKNHKIIKVQFICMLGVLFVHTYNLDLYQIQTGSGCFWRKLLLCSEEILSQDFGNRIAVPVFMMISAFLFYTNVDGYRSLGVKIKKRMKSIGIPYLIWNTIGTVFYLVIARLPFVAHIMSGTADRISIVNIISGVFLYKYYYPFWFLSRLLLFTCLSPAVYAIVQRKTTGIIAIVCFLVLNCFPIRDYYTVNSALFYLVGAYAAIHCQDRFTNQSKKSVSWLWLIILFIAVIARHLFANRFLVIIFTIAMPIVFWLSLNIVDFDKRKISKWETRSFFIFCAHTFVLEAFEKLIGRAFGINTFGAWMDYLLAPLFTVVSLTILYGWMRIHMPQTLNALCGGRAS